MWLLWSTVCDLCSVFSFDSDDKTSVLLEHGAESTALLLNVARCYSMYSEVLSLLIVN